MPLTLANFRSEVAARLRLDTNNSSQLTLIDRWVNIAVQKIHNREDWQWDQDREIVQTVVDKTAGTVAVSVGGTTVTGTSTAFAAADVDKYIQFSSSDDWYKVTAAASATSLTIESAYVGTSALSAGTYTIRQFYYPLSANAEKVLSISQAITPRKIRLVHFNDFDQSLLFSDASADPYLAAMWGRSSSGYLQFALYPNPDTAINLEVRIKRSQADLTAATDEPRIPNKWRWLVIETAIQQGLEHARTTDEDKRAEFKAQEVERAMQLMAGEAGPASDYHPVIQSRETRSGDRNLPQLPPEFDWRA